jgi:nucleoside-diphosphate-sugar epimerase
MKTILGTGQLGLAILEVLLQNNSKEQILLVNRTGKLGVDLPKNVELISADVTEKNDLEIIAQKSDLIFSCTDVPYQNWGDFYPKMANALAYALSKSNAKMVFADNMYSYGNVQRAEMNENFLHKAQTKKGKIRAEVIQILLNSGKEFSNRVSFVKAADFIGPNIYKGLFGTDFLEKLYAGKSIILSGKIDLPHTFTYIIDFAHAMVNVGNANEEAFGQIWHVPNAPAMNLLKWIQLFETETGKKAKIVVLPKFVVWLVGFFNEFVKELYELAYQFEYPYLVNHQKYVKQFGNQSSNPLTIVRETVQWYNKSTHEK